MPTPRIDRSKRNILLDTNVLSHLSNDNLNPKIRVLIREIFDAGYSIAISDLIYAELLNEATVEKDDQMYRELDVVPRFKISKKVNVLSARLGSFYKECGIDPKQINLGDRIMAATAAMNNCIILTTNMRDFPSPFFKEFWRKVITYENKGVPIMIVFYLMEPQNAFIGEYHKNRCKPYLDKLKKKKERDVRIINTTEASDL